MEKVKLKLNEIKLFIDLNIIEILLVIGLSFIVAATFIINKILCLYLIGFIFISLAVFLIKYPSKGRR